MYYITLDTPELGRFDPHGLTAGLLAAPTTPIEWLEPATATVRNQVPFGLQSPVVDGLQATLIADGLRGWGMSKATIYSVILESG